MLLKHLIENNSCNFHKCKNCSQHNDISHFGFRVSVHAKGKWKKARIKNPIEFQHFELQLLFGVVFFSAHFKKAQWKHSQTTVIRVKGNPLEREPSILSYVKSNSSPGFLFPISNFSPSPIQSSLRSG